MYSVRVGGLDESIKTAQGFPEACDSILAATLMAGGRFLMDAATRDVPVRTGFLRSTLYVATYPGGVAGIEAGASAPYAGFVHEGTRWMRARPFIAQNVPAAVAEVERRFDAAILAWIKAQV